MRAPPLRRPIPQGSWLIVAALSSACAEPATAELVDELAWAPVADADDPFVHLRPQGRTCDPEGIFVEDGLLEVDTLRCPWATVSQPSPIDLQPGDELSALVFHGPLVSDPPSEGQVLLRLASIDLIDEVVAIPAGTALYERSEVVQDPIAAGTPIYFHVHNHGGNDWRMSHLRVTSERRAVRRLAEEP